MKIVLTDSMTVTNGDIDISIFEKFGEVVYYPTSADNEVIGRVKDADAIICNKTIISRAVMESAPKLSYIGVLATGYNNIDTECAKERGITVCNAGSYSTQAVAQHVFSFILNHYNKIADYNKFVSEGGWKKSPTFSAFVYPSFELAGKTIGIIGYGNIGREVAKIANAFSMNVLVYTRTPKNDPSVRFTDLDTLVSNSDIVTVHCPLNAASKEMFNKQLFEKFKDGAYFINTSRGPVVNERALFDALECEKLSGAAVDVLEVEPMKNDCILFGAKNITVSPHIAWAPFETRRRLIDITVNNLSSYLAGNPQNVIV